MTQKVSKSSIKVSLFKLRSLLAALVLFFLAQGAWGQTTYTWTGAAGDNLWNTAGNWRTATENPATTIPGNNASDIVNIVSGVNIQLGNAVTIDKLLIPNPNGQTDSFTVTLTGNYLLTVSSLIETYRPTSDPGNNTSTLIFNCDITSASLTMHSGANITIAASRTANIDVIEHIGVNTPPTLLTVNGDLTANSVLMSETNNQQKILVDSTGSISSGTITGSPGSITNNGVIVTQNPINGGIINGTGSGTAVTAPSGSCVWTGAQNTSITNVNNWFGGIVPDGSKQIVIPLVEKLPKIEAAQNFSLDPSLLTIETGAYITVDGYLTLSGDYDISAKFDSASIGTLNVTGELSNNATTTVPSLALTCSTLDVSASLECKSISVTGTSTLTNSSGTTYLVARADDGISFGNTVTVNSSSNQFVLGGNVTAASAVNVNIESGMLNHVEENTSHNKSWSSNVTAVLQNNGCTFGMAAGTSYSPKVSATGGDVYFVGNGTFASLDDAGAGCNIHFGNNDATQSNAFTFGSGIAFNTTGNIVLDQSCSGLAGEVTLSGIKGIENRSSQLSSPLDVDISLTPGATISSSGNGAGKTIPFKNLTFSTGTNTVSEKISVAEDLTCRDTMAFSKDVSVAGQVIIIDDTTFTNAIDFGTAEISVTGGNNTDNITITAPSIKASSITCTDNNSSYLELNAAGGISITGDIGSSSNEYKAVKLDAGSNNISVGGHIYTSNIDVTCASVTFNDAIYVGSVAIHAGTVSINGLKSNSLSIDSGATSIKMGGSIKLASDFIIDYPLVLIADDTSFDITGKIIVKNNTKTGSIDSDAAATPRALTLKASGGIEIQNGNSLGGTQPLSAITVDSRLDLSNGAAFTTTTGTVFSSTGGTLSGSGTLAITGNLTNSGSWIFETDISVTGDVTDTGSWDSSAGKEIIFNGTGAQVFTPNAATTYSKITLNKSSGSFAGKASNELKAGVFTITACPQTVFNGVSTFTSFANTPSTTETITFANNTTINSAANFNRPVIISADARIETSGGQTYNGTVTPGANVTFTASTVDFKGAVTGSSFTVNGAAEVNTGEINTSGTQTYNGTVSLGADVSFTASTVNFKGAVTGTGLTVNGATAVNTGTINTSGDQTYKGTVTLENNATLTAPTVNLYANVAASAGQTLTVNADLSLASDLSITANQITFAGDISGTGRTLTINTSSFNSTKTGSAAVVSLASLNLAGDVTFASTTGIHLTANSISQANGSDFALTNNAALSLSAGITVGTDFANGTGSPASLTVSSGTTTFAGDLDLTNGTFVHSNGTIVLSPSAASMTLSGSSTFYNLTATGLGGKTITFASGTDQTVSGALQLSGTADEDNKRLVLTGTNWTITSTGTHSIQYVDVQNSTATNTLTALNSFDRGGNVNWNFPGFTYKWKGGAAGNLNDWNTAGNWYPATIPGLGANVEIPATGVTYYPVINQAIVFSDSTHPGTVTNNGTITFNNGGSITAGRVNGDDSTIIYDGAVDPVWGTSYKNLTISSGTLAFAENTTIENNFVNNGSATIADTKAVSIAGNVTSTGNISGPGQLIFNGNGAQIFLPNNKNYPAVSKTTSGSLSVSGGLNAVSLTTSAASTTYLQDGITTSGVQTYNGSVVLNGNTSLSSVTGITFASTVGGNHKLTTDSTVTFKAQVNIGELETQKAAIQTASVKTTAGGQTYNDEVTLGPATSLSVPAGQNIDFKGSLTGSNKLTTNQRVIFEGAVSVGSLETQKAAIQTASVVTTSGGQIYNDEVTLGVDTSLSVPAGRTINLESSISGAFNLETNQTANFNGSVNIAGLTTAAANIKTSAITTTGAQTYGGAVSVQENTSLTAGADITFGSTVNGDKKLTLAAGANDVIFNANVGTVSQPLYAAQITSAANTTFNGQTYITTFTDAAAGNITFNAGGAITDSTQFQTSGNVTFGDAAGDTFTFGRTSPSASYSNFIHTAGNTIITGSVNAAVAKLADTKLSGTLNATTVLYGNLTSDSSSIFTQNLFVTGNTVSTLGAQINVNKDFVIAKDTGKNITISQPLSVNGNFLLYSGNLQLNANLTTQKDLILVGSAYDASDPSTGYTNAYAYNTPRPDEWSQPSYIDASTSAAHSLASIIIPALPDTSVSNKAGVLTINPGTVIHVGKNFYANGITMSGSGTWYIDILKNSDSSVCFAEAYNCTVSNCTVRKHTGSGTTGNDDSDNAQIAAENCTLTSCANWDSEDFEITDAWTVRDNAVYIKFNRPVRNYKGELNNFVSNLKYYFSSDNDTSYTQFTSDADGTSPLTSEEEDEVYIIATGGKTWNTDARGSDSGTAGSTDRNGNHRNAKPYLDIPRSLGGSSATETIQSFVITDRFGKRLLNYSIRTKTSGSTFTNVLDHTGPVLYSVRTGQELHTAYDSAVGEASEHSYDSHNFIEFLYSEKVDFAGSSDDTALNNVDASTDTFVENIQVTDDLGAIKDSITVEGSLSFAGLGTIQNGLIHTGSNGSTDKYVNALYRIGDNAEYALRLSIAGYTDPLNTVTDPDGNIYKKWIGYIEKAVQPTGDVSHLVNASKENACVKDKEGNVQIKYENDSSNKIPKVNENGQTSPIFTSCYGDWDISEPIFAIIRQNIRTLWAAGTFAPDYQAEAIGNNSGVGSTLDRIEFHLYDNSPKFTSGSPEWFTEVGWCQAGSSGLKSELYLANDSYAADIFGGARAFDSTERTSGGIRYSTIVNSAGAFRYGVAGALPSSLFDTTKPVYPGATSLIFTGASNPRRAASDLEGLYFALSLPDSVSFDLKTSFTVSYNENQAYITDLAGNRLRSKTVSTVDRTPPSIDMTISPVGSDEVEIVFVKTLVTDSNLIHYITDPVSLQDETITEQFEYLIGKCFDIITINSSGVPAVVDSSDLKIDTTTPAKVWVTTNSNNSGFTHIKLKLNRAITLQDIQEKFIRVTYAPPYLEESVDLFTQKPGSRVTFIQDENGNTIQMYTAHALSDFAVGEVNPLYAYDSSMTESDGTIISGGLWHTDTSDDVDPQSWAVHDWNRDQKNYGTLPAGHTLAIVADTVSAANVNIYLANKPDARSLSTQSNKDFEFETPWRIWLPELMPGVFTPLAEKNNTSFAQKSGELLGDKANRFIFDLDSSITDLWSSGDQVSFLFGITKDDGSPVTIMHSPELDIDHDMQYLPTSTKMPLFALRQTDPEDFLSLDLWSFRLQSIAAQRGGVTVLNNVIDSTAGEKVVIRVDLPKEGNLNVLVMTLDGNIVDYLQRGNASKGEHYYSWDGSNRSGKPVARGMYFIRVMADGIDETRKVMVVKE